MNKIRIKTAIIAVLVAAATVVSAAVRPLPAPQSNFFPDRESSICATLTGWPDLGRNIVLMISAHATPSNAVQVAFGQDTNGNEDLEPEETQLIVGVDCGEWFTRDERAGSHRPFVVEDWADTGNSSPTNEVWAIRLKQVSSRDARFDFAKITTRGREETDVEISAEITRPGTALILR